MTQSRMPSATVSNTGPANCVITICNTNAAANAMSMSLFLKKLGNTLLSPNSRQLNALKSWNRTNSVNITVSEITSAFSPSIGMPRKFHCFCARHTMHMNMPLTAILTIISAETMLSPLAVGLRFIRSSRIGSNPSVSAGGPSMMMLIHNRSSALNGFSKEGTNNPMTVHRKIMATDATFTVSWNCMNRLKFS